MGSGNLLNTIMNTAHSLLLNTVFYLMGITVLTGALSKLLTEFGVVKMLEKGLRVLMKPLFNLPGAAALVGFVGAFCGSIISTRLMQRSCLKAWP